MSAERPKSTEVLREDAGGGGGGYRAAARGGEVVMVRRWRRPIHFLMLAVPLLFFAGLIALAAVVGADVFVRLGGQFWYPLLVGSVVSTYVGLCGLVNATRLELHDGMLKIVHGPLPVRKNLSWPTRDFTDVWTQHVRVSGAPDIYRLRVALKSGGELVIVDELPALADGVFLEEKIARHIGVGTRRPGRGTVVLALGV